MSKKNVTLYNKSERKFVLGEGLVLKPKSHTEVPAALAKTLCEKYTAELTDVKVEASSNNGELVKLEAAKAALAADRKALQEEKELFKLEVEEFEKAKTAN